jgi:hypothetical protein
MQIDKQVYYHIHIPESGKTELEVGKEYESGNSPNRFWGYYLNHEHLCNVAPYQGYCAAFILDRHINSPLFQNAELNKSMLVYSADVLKECGMFLRELIFEEIRFHEFPEAPSRRTALYLTDEADVQYWLSWFSGLPLPKLIYRVECSGIIHKGNQVFLDSDITSYSEYAQEARNYWSGVGVDGQVKTEILFQGKWKILEQV